MVFIVANFSNGLINFEDFEVFVICEFLKPWAREIPLGFDNKLVQNF